MKLIGDSGPLCDALWERLTNASTLIHLVALEDWLDVLSRIRCLSRSTTFPNLEQRIADSLRNASLIEPRFPSAYEHHWSHRELRSSCIHDWKLLCRYHGLLTSVYREATKRKIELVFSGGWAARKYHLTHQFESNYMWRPSDVDVYLRADYASTKAFLEYFATELSNRWPHLIYEHFECGESYPHSDEYAGRPPSVRSNPLYCKRVWATCVEMSERAIQWGDRSVSESAAMVSLLNDAEHSLSWDHTTSVQINRIESVHYFHCIQKHYDLPIELHAPTSPRTYDKRCPTFNIIHVQEREPREGGSSELADRVRAYALETVDGFDMAQCAVAIFPTTTSPYWTYICSKDAPHRLRANLVGIRDGLLTSYKHMAYKTLIRVSKYLFMYGFGVYNSASE